MKPASYFIAIAFLTFAIGVAAACAADKPAIAPVRVALVGTSADPRVLAIRELAEAQLAQGDQLQVLERQNVDRVLTEHGLTLSGLVDAEQAVKVGKLLSADLLAIIESDAKSQGAAFVIFDPTTGVRFWDAGLAIEDGAKAAESLAGAIRDAAAKRKKAADLRTICLMTVRNADLPHDKDGFCDAVGRLLERNLVGSSSVALLERNRLEQVSKERAIADGQAGHDLLLSLVTVELEISRGPDGHGLRAAAFLSDSQARSLGKLTAISKEEDAVALAASLADQFAAKLKVPPGATGDRAIEAVRFFREAQLRTNSSDYAHALVAAEAAHALVPENIVLYTTLARSLVFDALPPPRAGVGGPTAPWLAGTPVPLSALRGAAMMADVFPLTTRAPALPASVARNQLTEAMSILRLYLELQSSAQMRTPKKTPFTGDLAALKASARRYLLQEDALLRDAVNGPESSHLYSSHLIQLAYDFELICSSDSAQWSEDLTRTAGQWLELRAKHPGLNLQMNLNALDILAGPNHSLFDHTTARGWELTAEDFERWRALQKKLQADHDVLLSGYGDLLALTIDVQRARGSPDRMKQAVDDFVAAKKQLLTQPGTHDQPQTLCTLYHLIAESDKLLDETAYAGQVSIALLDLALSRNEIETGVIYQGLYARMKPSAAPSPAEKTRRIAVIEHVLQVAHAPGCLMISPGFDESYFRTMLESLRHPNNSTAGFATTRPWISQKKLLDVLDTDGLENVFQPIVAGNSVFALATTAEKPRNPLSMQLLRIPLDGKPMQRLGSLPTNIDDFTLTNPEQRVDTFVPQVTDACLAEGRYCAATRDQGVMIFPTDGSAPTRLDEKNGLPTAWAQAIALVDGKVYAGLGKEGNESYIVSYDLAMRKVDVVASNVRKDKRSPFDDGTSFKIRGLIADPPRHRLIVAIERYEPKPIVNGIWEYKTQTGEWRHLLPLHLHVRETGAFGSYIEDRIWSVRPAQNECFAVATSSIYFLFDLRNDQAHALSPQIKSRDPALPPATPDFAGLTPAGRKSLERLRGPQNTVTAFDPPFVWTTSLGATPWGRFNCISCQREFFDTLRPDVHAHFKPRFLSPLGDGSRLLVGDGFGLWLLTFPKD